MEDDSYKIILTNPISDMEKNTLQYQHSQILTQPSSFAYSINNFSDVSN